MPDHCPTDSRLTLKPKNAQLTPHSQHSISYRRMLTARPFWVVLALSYSYDFGNYLLLTGVPKFMHQVLGFQLQATGWLAALPLLAATACSLTAAAVGDAAVRGAWLPLLWLRRVFVLICECGDPDRPTFNTDFPNAGQNFCGVITSS